MGYLLHPNQNKQQFKKTLVRKRWGYRIFLIGSLLANIVLVYLLINK